MAARPGDQVAAVAAVRQTIRALTRAANAKAKVDAEVAAASDAQLAASATIAAAQDAANQAAVAQSTPRKILAAVGAAIAGSPGKVLDFLGSIV
jgi:hypothetical protein